MIKAVFKSRFQKLEKKTKPHGWYFTSEKWQTWLQAHTWIYTKMLISTIVWVNRNSKCLEAIMVLFVCAGWNFKNRKRTCSGLVWTKRFLCKHSLSDEGNKSVPPSRRPPDSILVSLHCHLKKLQSRGVMKTWSDLWTLYKIMSTPATESPTMEGKVVSQEMALLSNLLAAYTFIAGKTKTLRCDYIYELVSLLFPGDKRLWTMWRTGGCFSSNIRWGWSNERCENSKVVCSTQFLTDQPERTALVFLGGVCVGLLVTLCAIVFQIHCRADCHHGNSKDFHHRHRTRHHRRRLHSCPHYQPGDGNPDDTGAVVLASGATGPTGDSEPDDWDDTSDRSARRRRRFERALLNATMFTSSEGVLNRNVNVQHSR